MTHSDVGTSVFSSIVRALTVNSVILRNDMRIDSYATGSLQNVLGGGEIVLLELRSKTEYDATLNSSVPNFSF